MPPKSGRTEESSRVRYGVLVDAWNWMAVIRYEANAAAELGVQSGDPVWLTAG